MSVVNPCPMCFKGSMFSSSDAFGPFDTCSMCGYVKDDLSKGLVNLEYTKRGYRQRDLKVLRN